MLETSETKYMKDMANSTESLPMNGQLIRDVSHVHQPGFDQLKCSQSLVESYLNSWSAPSNPTSEQQDKT